MGGCMSAPEADPVQVAANKEVEKALKETKEKMAKQVKVLLLGSGDSGKSTILKQMRLIHKVPFTPQEIEFYRQLVYNNVLLGTRAILDAMEDLDIEVADDNQQNAALFDTYLDLKDGESFNPMFLEPLKQLWMDPAVQKTYGTSEIPLPENMIYYMNDLDRLWRPSYAPTEQDIIRTRSRTTGITETIFKIDGQHLHMVDVGGQKSERRKWIHCFENVTTILFLVSLSGYDQSLAEDKDANQMQDALSIWDSVCHSQWFKRTALILFLNKTDIFEDKVKHSDIKNTFPDYDGAPGDVQAGKDYFRRRFQKLAVKSNRQKDRDIYTHFTNATDTGLLKAVIGAVEDVTLRQGLTSAGLM